MDKETKARLEAGKVYCKTCRHHYDNVNNRRCFVWYSNTTDDSDARDAYFAAITKEQDRCYSNPTETTHESYDSGVYATTEYALRGEKNKNFDCKEYELYVPPVVQETTVATVPATTHWWNMIFAGK